MRLAVHWWFILGLCTWFWPVQASRFLMLHTCRKVIMYKCLSSSICGTLWRQVLLISHMLTTLIFLHKSLVWLHRVLRTTPLVVQYLLLLLLVEYIIWDTATTLDLNAFHKGFKSTRWHALSRLVLCHMHKVGYHTTCGMLLIHTMCTTCVVAH